MVLIIDNYDSFTYNLYQYIGCVNSDIEVYRNDKITIDEIKDKNPSHIIISPGPKYPKDSGICLNVIKQFAPHIPILGVCLGHQSIGEAFGGKIVQAPKLMHGKSDFIKVKRDCKLFKNVNKKTEVGRYHSLIIENESLPDCLEITAISSDNCIMGIKHKEYEIYGIQFHPESVLTPDGIKIIENFLKN